MVLPSLSSSEKKLFIPLHYPQTFDIFAEKAPHGSQVAFAAYADHQPIGLITCFTFIEIKDSLIVSFAVSPSFQKKGVGLLLMRNLLEHLKTLGIKIVQFTYNTWEVTTPAIESILSKTGWQPSELYIRRYFFDQHSFHPAWYFSPFPLLPHAYEIFRWEEIKPQEIKQIENWINQNKSLENVSPFRGKLPYEPLNSLGLRHKGEIAGWMITHRVEPKIIRYSALYTHPEIRGLGPAICLLKESLRWHISNEITTLGLMEINVQSSPFYWQHFIQKRLAPVACKTQDVKKSYFLINTAD